MKSIDMSVKMCGITFKNPVLPASSELALDVKGVRRCLEHGCGGIVLKSTPHINAPLAGRSPRPYMASLRPLSLKGSFLADPSLPVVPPDEYLTKEVPEIVKICQDAEVPLIASLWASSRVDEWIELAEKFAAKGVNMLELNFGCPHAEFFAGKGAKVGRTVGEDEQLAAKIIRSVKKAVDIPVSIKVSPHLNPSSYYAKVYANAGADALSAHNGLYGLVIDTEREEVFGSYGTTGYNPGRPFLPLSLAKVNEMMEVVNIPISGIGGITEPEDAIQYILLGCPTVQVASAIFVNGYAQFDKIIRGIAAWMERKGYRGVEEFRGKVKCKEPATMPLPDQYEFKVPEIERGPAIIKVDMDRCNLCGICADTCLYGVFEIDKEGRKMKIHDERCWNCGMCVGLCPVSAITLIKRKTKEVLWDGRGTQKKFLPKG